MGVTFIAPQGTYTAPAKLVTKEITENGTYDATDDSANGYSSVTVNVEGGGGSSDFSTAEVTAVNNTGNPISAANIIHISNGAMADASVIIEGTDNKTAVLYKNMARWMVSTGTVTATGNATVESGRFGSEVVITGDCTITIS